MLDIATAHRCDPVSSHEAGEAHKQSGKLSKECEEILAAIRRFPYCTAGEISLQANIDYYLVQKRVSVLERKGLIERQLDRVCRVRRGKPVTVWAPKNL